MDSYGDPIRVSSGMLSGGSSSLLYLSPSFTINYHYRGMDIASVVLSEGLDPTKSRTYAALSEYSNVPRTTLWYRAYGRPSIEEKVKSQQYLTPLEEKALVEYLKCIRLEVLYQ
jgi:hypothetical protein